MDSDLTSARTFEMSALVSCFGPLEGFGTLTPIASNPNCAQQPVRTPPLTNRRHHRHAFAAQAGGANSRRAGLRAVDSQGWNAGGCKSLEPRALGDSTCTWLCNQSCTHTTAAIVNNPLLYRQTVDPLAMGTGPRLLLVLATAALLVSSGECSAPD